MEDARAKSIVERLYKAVQNKSVDAILNIYKEAQYINWEQTADEVFEEYNQLVDKANDIIYVYPKTQLI